MSAAISRRNMLKGGAAAAIAGAATASISTAAIAALVVARVEPIIGLCADAMRADDAWNRACAAYRHAADAAEAAGMPSRKPEDALIGPVPEAVQRRTFAQTLAKVVEESGEAPQIVASFRAAAEQERIPAERAERARALRSARAYRAALARWEEADARFGITAALAAADRAGAVAYAALDAVEAASVASPLGALAVFRLGAHLIADDNEERGRALLTKGCGYSDPSGILESAPLLPLSDRREGGAA